MKNYKHQNETEFLWVPGKGYTQEAVTRMRHFFRCPAKPMGEAWFLAEERRTYPQLLGKIDDISFGDLTYPLQTSMGATCFGPLEEWHDWYHYLLSQLIHRSHEKFIDYYLLEYLISGFIVQYPDGINNEPYSGFRNDALNTLGRCIMDQSCWSGGHIQVGKILNDPEDKAQHWWRISGDFSASMFFCSKYLRPEEIEPWLKSALFIDCAQWNAQMMIWIMGAHDLLTGKIQQPAELHPWEPASVTWEPSYCLKGNYSGDFSEQRPADSIFLPKENRNEISRVLKVYLTEILFGQWMSSIQQYDYLTYDISGLSKEFYNTYIKNS